MPPPRTLPPIALLALFSIPAAAQEIIREVDAPAEASEPEVFHTPYAFYTPDWSLAVGYGIVATGQLQEQLTLFSTAALSVNGTGQLIFGTNGAHIPGTERLFFDGYLSAGRYRKLRAYVGTDSDGVRAGSNDSSADNFIEADATDLQLELPFRVVLPLGPGREEPVQTYLLDRGVLAGAGTGGRVWNPLASGRTYLGLAPFYRRQSSDAAEVPGQPATNGLAAAAWYDNTDFPRNPTFGSFQEVRVLRDFGALDSTQPWTVVEGRASKYVDLGATGWSRQQVLALGVWTANTPTWSDEPAPAGARSAGAPPYYMGATLGGQTRLRAYPAYRFNDQAAVHYWLEYRMIPGWQPLPRIDELRRAEVDWWQIAAFAEVGRVAPSWTLGTLHEDLKWDVGLSLRIFAKKALVRLDLAAGPEGVVVRFDLGQPF